MKVFFDVDGVLVGGWHARPERRKPWDATLEQDLGISQAAFQETFFDPRPDGSESLMHACMRGDRDMKETLAEVLPALGYHESVDAFVAYWFKNDSNVNGAVLDVVKRLGRHDQVELYLATGQERYRAAYLWDDLGFRAYFKDMFYSARLGYLKDTPAFYETVNVELGIVSTERPLYFDDREDAVHLAREVGWDAHVFDAIEDMLDNPRLRGLLQD